MHTQVCISSMYACLSTRLCLLMCSYSALLEFGVMCIGLLYWSNIYLRDCTSLAACIHLQRGFDVVVATHQWLQNATVLVCAHITHHRIQAPSTQQQLNAVIIVSWTCTRSKCTWPCRPQQFLCPVDGRSRDPRCLWPPANAAMFMNTCGHLSIDDKNCLFDSSRACCWQSAWFCFSCDRFFSRSAIYPFGCEHV